MEMKFDKLSNLCDIQIGKTPSRKVSKYWGKGYPWVAISDLKKRYICKTKEQITSEAVIEAGCKLIPKDTLLMSFKLSIGKLAFTTCDLYTNEAIVALSVKNKKEIDNNYLYYALQNIPLLGGAKVAVKGNTLNKKSLGKLKIPLPKSIDDQIKIANLLSQVEALIAKREESINLLDELLKSTFLDMFGDPVLNTRGWDSKPLKKFGKVSTGNTPPRKEPAYYTPEYIEWIKTDNINKNKMYLTKAKEYLSEKGLERGRLVKENSLLVTCIAGSVKSIGNASISNRKVTFNQQINAIEPNDDISVYFLYWMFKISKKYVQDQAGKGMKKMISKSTFEKLLFHNPPKPLQDKFATIVQQAEESKKRYQDSLNELHQLFGSLSQRAFKGELDLSGVEIPVVVKISDAIDLGVPKPFSGPIVIESQKVEHSKGRAKCGAGDLEEVLGIPTFALKQIEDMTGVTQIAEAIKQENLKPVVQQIEALKKSIDLSETMKQISSTAKLFKSLNIPGFKIDIPPLNVQIPHIDAESLKIFQTSQQLMESMQKRKEHVYQMLEDIPQIKQAIEEDVLCKDDFLDVTLRFDYEYAEIKRIIMDKLASNEIVQYFDEEKKIIKLGKAT